MKVKNTVVVVFGRELEEPSLEDEKIYPLANVKYWYKENDYMNKHLFDAYDDEGRRRVKAYKVVMKMKSGYSEHEEYAKEEERDARWLELGDL